MDQCIAVHTAVQRKKARLVGGPISAPPCPQCKATIMAQCVNITLQNIITERLAIEENMRRAEIESIYPKTPVRGQLLYEELVTSRKADFVRSTSTSSLGLAGFVSHAKHLCTYMRLLAHLLKAWQNTILSSSYASACCKFIQETYLIIIWLG